MLVALLFNPIGRPSLILLHIVHHNVTLCIPNLQFLLLASVPAVVLASVSPALLLPPQLIFLCLPFLLCTPLSFLLLLLLLSE